MAELFSTAILAVVVFCSAGVINIDDTCEDGSQPKKWSVSILRGEPVSRAPDCVGICIPKTVKLNSLVEISENNRVLFRLKPDGTTENAADFNPDDAGRAFWLGMFGALGPAAENYIPRGFGRVSPP